MGLPHAFAGAGLVHVFTGEQQRYRLCAPAPHVHLVCQACGLVIERAADVVRAWWGPAHTEADFVVNVEHSDMYGLCGQCRTGRAPAPTGQTRPGDGQR